MHERTFEIFRNLLQDCLTSGRVWRGRSTLGELIVASPARRRERPGHPRLSHLSSSCLLPHATPAAGFGVGRTGNASTTTSDDGVQARPTARLLPGGAAFPHGPFCNKRIASYEAKVSENHENHAAILCIFNLQFLKSKTILFEEEFSTRDTFQNLSIYMYIIITQYYYYFVTSHSNVIGKR